ncbi:hypothetical protein BJ322DRAFT_1006438 [Thelephora terrestris]|uniref:Uncharacterized protein n=1 Tax=Thelephora terrestris TaxID=56493 RepID=A0A9P6HF41_9AGAM|nr:hypothetical protein BJ322DRAFT_1006438 [Thelephora terrestris]
MTKSSSTTAHGSHPTGQVCTFEDWQDIKELFAKAAEQYNETDAVEAMPLLRAVIHECHRFLLFYPDPSELILQPSCPPSPDQKRSVTKSPSQRQHPQKGKDAARPEDPVPSPNETLEGSNPNLIAEQPTAFHAILGITLFLFGNLIAHDPSLALEGESASPTAYWLAALDVFETGESLPSRTDPKMCDAPEDWRMAVVWGRTLVCLADVKITRSINAAQGNLDCLNSQGCFTAEDEPDWSPDSPFHAIASRRPPVTRRMTLTSASAHDLMVLAMDQFSRGILHMPRRHPSLKGDLHQHALTIGPHFSRAGELFAIASEVLGVAERLDSPDDRHRFSFWADSIFNQVLKSSLSASTEWSTRVALCRGRCWLNMASSKIEEYESSMERGDDSILGSLQVAETRDELVTAIEYFEQAKSADPSTIGEDELAPLRPLLVEALVSLANLYPDETEREKLYSRAQKESGDCRIFWGDEDSMDMDP